MQVNHFFDWPLGLPHLLARISVLFKSATVTI